MASCITTAELMAFFCPAFASVGCASTGIVEFTGAGEVGDAIRIGSLVAVAVAGDRAAGSLTWEIGDDAEESATSFAAMLADSLMSEIVTGSLVTATVDLTTIATGHASLLALVAVGNAYTLTAFTGGTVMVDAVVSAVCRLVGLCFGSQRVLAQYMLAAHMLAGIAGRDMGTQTSAAINAISAGFAATPFGPADAVFANTSYGRQFLLIRSMVPRFGFSAIDGLNGGGCGC